MAIRFRGTREFATKLRRIDRQLDRDAQRLMDQLGDDMRDEVRRRMSGPVLKIRTGQLWRSVVKRARGRGKNRTVWVTSDVFHAPFHEFGTSHERPKPLWRPVMRLFERRFIEQLRGMFRRAFT
jgi:HK97 gp10 family phage protein